MSWTQISRPKACGWGRLSILLLPIAAWGVLFASSCPKDFQKPLDTAPPSPVQDLDISAAGDSSIELSWTNTGDDGNTGTATRVEVRALAGRAITLESDWQAAQLPSTPPGAPGAPGSRTDFRFGGLQPDQLYGFAVRLFDAAENRSALSNSKTARTNTPVPPEAGRLEVRLRSVIAGGYLGMRIQVAETVLVQSTLDSVYTFPLSDGAHIIRVFKECALLDPPNEQSVQIQHGQTSRLVWRCDPIGAVTVVSAIPGAEILVDGNPIGRQTPDTLRCLGPGSHTVKCKEMIGGEAGPDSVQTVIVGTQPQSLFFSFEPRPQARRVLQELFSATFCTVCPTADRAAAMLLQRTDLIQQGYFVVHTHVSWGGSDVFYPSEQHRAEIKSRIELYNAMNNPPVAVFDGLRPLLGAPGNATYMADLYESQVRAIFNGDEGPSRVSLYWLSATHSPDHSVQGTIRVMLQQDLAAADSTRLWFLVYKDSLNTNGIEGPTTYHNVVRAFRSAGNLTRDHDLVSRGSFADVEVNFDLAWDAQWSEARMGMIAFVQDPATKEIDQMAHWAFY